MLPPLPLASLHFLVSWSGLIPLIISPTLLAFHIIYVPMIPNICFQHLLTLELLIHTQQPTGALHLAMYLDISNSLSPNGFLLLPLPKPLPCHLMSTPSFQVFRPPEHGVNLHCFLSLVLHIRSVFLQRDPESDHHSLPLWCPLCKPLSPLSGVTATDSTGFCLCSGSLIVCLQQVSQVAPSKKKTRNSLGVQWLGLSAFTARAGVQSGVGELRFCKPHGVTKRKKKKKIRLYLSPA